ncbi:alpha/beta hydrolase [Paenibacillus xanthanilyticus]|uniref:Alpha/beta hydrolase n=1 Tax=Paenibacillus xanthanilyticus TaxID=1783531 RepID=A0ABV8K5C8_9BACL
MSEATRAAAAADPASPVTAAAALPGTTAFEITSRANGRLYAIQVAIPRGAPPEQGFPVIYVLDGNAIFPFFAQSQRLLAARPDVTGVVPAVIIGIGYPGEEAYPPARHYDFTLTSNHAQLPANPSGKAWPEQGGAAPFQDFLEHELKPVIESRYPINRRRQSLFGHSLGGLFVLHALFTRPSAFQTYIAGSPSIHWNERLLLEEERLFAEQAALGSVAARLYIAAGELERSHHSGMNANAAAMTKRLARLTSNGLDVRFDEIEDEGHLSVLLPLTGRALRFAAIP